MTQGVGNEPRDSLKGNHTGMIFRDHSISHSLPMEPAEAVGLNQLQCKALQWLDFAGDSARRVCFSMLANLRGFSAGFSGFPARTFAPANIYTETIADRHVQRAASNRMCQKVSTSDTENAKSRNERQKQRTARNDNKRAARIPVAYETHSKPG